MLGRLICLVVGHERDTVWLNMALGLSRDNPERPGTGIDSPEWAHFGGGNIFLCPRCRVVFLPLPDKFERAAAAKETQRNEEEWNEK